MTSFHMAACFKTDIPLFFPSSLNQFWGKGDWGGGGGGGGGGGREGRRPHAFRAPEISPLTEVAAVAGDDQFGADKRAWC